MRLILTEIFSRILVFATVQRSVRVRYFCLNCLGQTERAVVSTEGFALLPAFAGRPF
jgi:hypothetical protein